MPHKNIGRFIDILGKKVESKKAMLATGEKPRPRLQNRLQRIAGRALAGFFILMLAFTLVSRAADGITIAKVKTDTVKSGVLTDRVTMSGSIEPLGDLQLTLPGGLLIDSVIASTGQKVNAGDVLMELNEDEMFEQLTKLKNSLHILELKIEAAESGITSSDTSAIDYARQSLEQARADYERLEEKLARSVLRAEEDFEQAVTAYHTAVEKARTDLIKAAEDKLKAAQAALASTRESADEAIDNARQAYDSAREKYEAAERSYANALNNVRQAENRLMEAKQRLSELEAADPPDAEAIAAAKAQVQSAQSALDSARNALDMLGSPSMADYKRAEETLNRTIEKWQRRIVEAEDALKEAEIELAVAKANTDMSDQPGVISAQKALQSAQRALEDITLSREDQLLSSQRAVEAAQRSLEQAQRQAADSARNDEKSRRQAEIERLSYLSEKRTLEKSITILEEIAEMGGDLVSPIDGTVLSIAERGKTQEGAQVAVISRSDLGFAFTARLDQKKVETLLIGDKGILTYTLDGKTKETEAVVTSIGTADDKGEVIVTSALPEGTYPSGATGEMTVTRRSEMQSACLPVSALRSDSSGDYVLVIREKRSVMGLEQTVTRVPVTVLSRDSELMSIDSTLTRSDQVVISSNKPIAEGDRVRHETQ